MPRCGGGDRGGVRTSDEEPVYATLHFYYYDPDSMRRLQECLQAPDVLLAVEEFEKWIDGFEYDHKVDAEVVRDKLFDCFNNYDVKVPGWE